MTRSVREAIRPASARLRLARRVGHTGRAWSPRSSRPAPAPRERRPPVRAPPPWPTRPSRRSRLPHPPTPAPARSPRPCGREPQARSQPPRDPPTRMSPWPIREGPTSSRPKPGTAPRRPSPPLPRCSAGASRSFSRRRGRVPRLCALISTMASKGSAIWAGDFREYADAWRSACSPRSPSPASQRRATSANGRPTRQSQTRRSSPWPRANRARRRLLLVGAHRPVAQTPRALAPPVPALSHARRASRSRRRASWPQPGHRGPPGERGGRAGRLVLEAGTATNMAAQAKGHDGERGEDD